MAEMIIDAPKITVGVKIKFPRFYGLRMKALLWVFRLAQYVAPPGVLVEVLTIKSEADMPLNEGMVKKGGINRGPSKVVSRPAPPASMNRHG